MLGRATPHGPAGAVGRTGPTFGQEHTFATGSPTKSLAHLEATLNAAAAAQSAVPQASFVIPKGRLIHADANLQVVVPDCSALTTATNKATAIVTQLGGYAQSVQYRASQHCSGSAYLILHVPLGKTETAITRLGGLGELVSQSVSTQDLQQTYRKQTTKLGQLQQKIAGYEQALGERDAHELAAGRDGVPARAGQARAHGDAEESHPDGEGRHDVRHPALADDEARRLGGRRGAAQDRAHRPDAPQHGQFLAVEGIVVLYILLVAGPILLVGGLIWWFTSGRRRRDEKELLASA